MLPKSPKATNCWNPRAILLCCGPYVVCAVMSSEYPPPPRRHRLLVGFTCWSVSGSGLCLPVLTVTGTLPNPNIIWKISSLVLVPSPQGVGMAPYPLSLAGVLLSMGQLPANRLLSSSWRNTAWGHTSFTTLGFLGFWPVEICHISLKDECDTPV